MADSHEEIKVGALVVLAGILFLSALVFVGGVNLFRKTRVSYVTYLKFAGGLEPGNLVRFGGLKVGVVRSAGIDPRDSTRIQIRLDVDEGTPLRVNSVARISTLGFLGENYLEISPGTRDAALLKPGSEVPAAEIVQLADVFNNVNDVTVNANKLVTDLDDRFVVLANKSSQLINNLNAVVSPENREHFNSVLANADTLLAESRPQVRRTLANLDKASAKLGPTVENADRTLSRVDTLAGNVNAVVLENRREIHEMLLRMRESLAVARGLMANLDDALVSNRDNLDEILENMRTTSQNLKQFSDTIKQHPFTLVRVKTRKDRVPPVGK